MPASKKIIQGKKQLKTSRTRNKHGKILGAKRVQTYENSICVRGNGTPKMRTPCHTIPVLRLMPTQKQCQSRFINKKPTHFNRNIPNTRETVENLHIHIHSKVTQTKPMLNVPLPLRYDLSPPNFASTSAEG
jgi:hypothetical protein